MQPLISSRERPFGSRMAPWQQAGIQTSGKACRVLHSSQGLTTGGRLQAQLMHAAGRQLHRLLVVAGYH